MIGAEGNQIGIVTPQEGIRLAREAGLDLIEISPTAKPPVCRILDFGKYVYQLEKKEKQARKNRHVMHNKEVKLSAKIHEHDYQTKLRSAVKFLTRGDKVKLTLMFRGREIAHTEIGRRVIDRFVQDVIDVGEAEKAPELENKLLIVVLNPKPQSHKKIKKENESVKDNEEIETKNEESGPETV